MTGSFICIGSSRLTVEIARSGLLYQRSRFDRTGQIRQVRLDDGTVFCGADTRSASQNCGAFGLMNEYMPSDQGTYDTADPDGGVFLKMGVGLLRRVGPEAYSQKTDYPVAEKAIVKEWADANTYHASVSQREFNGFAYVAERTLTIYQDSLLSSYCVQNKGVKALHFNEYAHNFYCTGKNRFAWDMLFFTSFEAEPHPQELIKQGKRFRIQPFEQVAACELTDWLEIGAVPPNIAVQCPGHWYTDLRDLTGTPIPVFSLDTSRYGLSGTDCRTGCRAGREDLLEPELHIQTSSGAMNRTE
jgi:hypothetical protein